MLSVEVTVQQGSLRHIIGDKQKALELGKIAWETAESINDKSGQLSALLLITKVSNDPQLIETAITLAEELHLTREKTLINFNTLELLLEEGKTDEAALRAEEILPRIEFTEEDIELAWMCNIAAELMITKHDHESAEKYLMRARRVANCSDLLPEMAVTLTLQGKLDFIRGRFEESYRNFKNALQVFKQIAQNLTSETDRRFFQNKRYTVYLIDEIKRLGSLLGRKKGRVAT
jgi:tetratricopeptide (TPR) repeat protein